MSVSVFSSRARLSKQVREVRENGKKIKALEEEIQYLKDTLLKLLEKKEEEGHNL